MEQPALPPTPSQPRSKKPLIIGSAVAAALLLGVGLWLTFSSSWLPKAAEQPPVPTEFSAASETTPHTYAGNKVYDACNLVSLDTVKRVVPRYDEGLKTINTPRHPPKQYTIDHIYIDRDINSPIKPDDTPRLRQTSVSTSEGTDSTESISSYISAFDSQCAYRQGSDSVFLKVFVTQPPTPLASDLLAYLNAKPSEQVERRGAITIYKDTKVADGPYTALLLTSDKKIATILQSATPELFAEGLTEITEKLQKTPAGAFTMQYPQPYNQLINPCTIFTAADFERLNHQPTRATAFEKLVVTKTSNDPVLERRCERIGISDSAYDAYQSRVVIAQFPTVERAVQYITDETNPEVLGLTGMKATATPLGDGSFTAINVTDGRGYLLKIRIGAAVVAIRNDTSISQDASQEAFEARMMPIGQAVVEGYKKLVR